VNCEDKLSQCKILIPAVKKNVAFADDLIKKLDGVMLIQRAIDKAMMLVDAENILVITDSEEISVICERNNVAVHYDRLLRLDERDALNGLGRFFAGFAKDDSYATVLWPYAPLVSAEEIKKAFNEFIKNGYEGLISVKGTRHEFVLSKTGLKPIKCFPTGREYFVEVKAFMIMQPAEILSRQIRWQPFELNDHRQEIKDYHDWWVCERLLKRKRIIFRVIGYNEVGMGHVYRALSLAHENTNDEILFICGEESVLAVSKIAGHDYCLEVLPQKNIENRILALKPDMVIHDILDTKAVYIKRLKAAGIKVVNFEDLGAGALAADLVFNDLYDQPRLEGTHFRWGRHYHFLRDEFLGAKPHSWTPEIHDVLLAFGGTDPTNLSMRILKTIDDFCRQHDIRIHIVVGMGYSHSDQIFEYVKAVGVERIRFTNQTGVMSKIMEQTPIAISSNGRTVYELAHMHIPSIIISHHDREQTHQFAIKENGFISLNVYREGETEEQVLKNFKILCLDHEYRRKLFDWIKEFNFLPNKRSVISEIEALLHAK
jgi:spore coat polysaccharide biosynthesis predicted glycosyltransferase SpsG